MTEIDPIVVERRVLIKYILEVRRYLGSSTCGSRLSVSNDRGPSGRARLDKVPLICHL